MSTEKIPISKKALLSWVYILVNNSLARISLSPQESYGYAIIYFKQLTRMVDP